MQKELTEQEELENLMLTKKEKKVLRQKANRDKKNKEEDKQFQEESSNELKNIIKKSEQAQKIININDRIQPEQEIVSSNNNTQLIPDLVKPKESSDAGKVIQNQVARPPMDESGDVDLNKLFSSEVGNDSDVVKELFSSENIKVKTELTSDEISIIARLELQATMTQNFFLSKVIKELETLRVSKERKSRGEFVSSFGGIKDANSGVTAFGKLGSIFKNDKV